MKVHSFPGSAARSVRTLEKKRMDELYQTKRWKVIRRRVLDVEPLCRMCRQEGVYTQARVVDHVVPHRGDVERFWDETGLQPLCKPCHDRKTASETISPGIVPQRLPESQACVVLVCGAPGSGRSAYAHAHAGPGDEVLDVEQEAATAAGTARYMSPQQYRAQAYGRAVSTIRRHAVEGEGKLFVCLELPQSTARKEWKLYLGERCEVVVLPCQVDQVCDEARGLAIAWLSKYTEDPE